MPPHLAEQTVGVLGELLDLDAAAVDRARGVV
jgi:hypothetical protein